MDRFSSREEPQPWDDAAFRAGAQARREGKSWVTNPYPMLPPSWAMKSWQAGWSDADATLASETMSSRIAEWKMTPEEFIAHRLKKRAP